MDMEICISILKLVKFGYLFVDTCMYVDVLEIKAIKLFLMFKIYSQVGSFSLGGEGFSSSKDGKSP